jgi:hypothetical protein
LNLKFLLVRPLKQALSHPKPAPVARVLARFRLIPDSLIHFLISGRAPQRPAQQLARTGQPGRRYQVSEPRAGPTCRLYVSSGQRK